MKANRMVSEPGGPHRHEPPVMVLVPSPLWVQKLWGRRQRSGTVVVVRNPMEVPP
jgi:hypothetical protein